MKILDITIHNLASIADASIDFNASPLAQCNTFLISGPTGAGKTTVLDAISLALYNKTSRLPGAKKNSISREALERIRTGCKEAEVRLHIIGNDEQEYEIVWRDKIGIRKGEQKALISQQLTNLNTGIIIGESKDFKQAIEQQIVGLDSDQFFRTTMLAQHDFTKFLKADEDEKSSILAKLSDTGKYDKIGKYINNQTNEARRNKENTELSMGNMQLMTDEQIAELNKQKDEINKQCEQENKEIEKLQQIINQINTFESNKKTIQNINNNIENSKDVYGKNLSLLRQAKQQLSNLEEQFNNYQQVVDKPQHILDVYDNFNAINSNLQSMHNKQKQIANATTDINNLEAEIKTKRQDENSLKDSVKKIEDKRDDINKHLSQKKPITDYQQELNQLNSNLQEIGIYKNKKADLLKAEKIFAEINKSIAASQAKLATEKKALAEADSEYNNAVNAQNEAQEKYNKTFASVADDLGKIRQALKEGDLCPVCGQKITHILENGTFAQIQENARKNLADAKLITEEKLKQVKERQNAINLTNDVISKAEGRKENGKIFVADAKNNIEKLNIYCQIKDLNEQQLDDLCNKINKSINSITDEIKTLSTLQNKLNKIAEEYNAENQKLTKLSALIENKTETCNEKKQNINLWQKEIDALTQTLDNQLSAYDSNWQTTDYDTFISELNSSQLQYQDAKLHIAKLKEQIQQLKGQNEASERLQMNCINLLPELAQQEEIIVDFDQTYALKWNQFFSDLQHLTNQINELNNQQLEISNNLGETLNHKADIGLQKDQHQATRDNALSQIGQINAQLLRYEQDRFQYNKFEQQYISDCHKYELWKRLNDIYGGPDGKYFQQIAQSHVMRYLLGRANNYLQRLTNRYSLTCDSNSLRILVIDHDSGSQKRDSANLSGGESFIVSLALALGLSDLNMGGLKVDTLFIDEGFGSLSNEPLQNAIETILNLHKLQNGRKVGIISHIDALKENIHPQLIVKKGAGENAPSTIEIIE